MTRFTAAKQFKHDSAERCGVLLVQLGSPEAAETGAVRRYLREFLSDPRVVELPRLIWMLMLHGVILRFRPAKSAAKYRSIWSKLGSPLRVHTEAQTKMLSGYLGARGRTFDVAFAMRYGQPSVAKVLRHMREQQLTRLMVVPMYPQYASATTGSVFDALAAELSQWRNVPELRFVRNFNALEGYIDAVSKIIKKSWHGDGPPDKLLMSFHGVPKSTHLAGDPYFCECHLTARLIAENLGLKDEQWQVVFQSRFGRGEWLSPSTADTLTALGRAKAARVDVVCPGFVADCVETLEEIAIEGRQQFLAAGGGEFRYISCVNDSPDFIAALAGLVELHSRGWPTLRHVAPGVSSGPNADPQIDVRKQRKARARAMGAKT